MIWKKHSDGVPNVLIPNAKILSKKACDATLGKPHRSFVAFSDNLMTRFIRTFKLRLNDYAISFILILQCKFYTNRIKYKFTTYFKLKYVYKKN